MHPRVLGLLLTTAATAAAGVGCGESVDYRWEDDGALQLKYLTGAVFAPSCGATQCHSTFTQAEGFVFDTPEGVRQSLLVTESGGEKLLRFDYERPDPKFSAKSRLYRLISENAPFEDVPRMPLDAPMSWEDIELLRVWIKDPNSGDAPFGVGGNARGAQCNPEANDGFACDDSRVVECRDSWNFGDVVVECANGCSATCAGSPCDPETMCR